MPNELNDKEIREAVEGLQKAREEINRHLGEDLDTPLTILLDLATAYLNVDGLPEEMEEKAWNHYADGVAHGHNTCLDLCKVVIARDYVKRDFNELVNSLKDDFGEHIEIKMKDIIEMENPKCSACGLPVKVGTAHTCQGASFFLGEEVRSIKQRHIKKGEQDEEKN